MVNILVKIDFEIAQMAYLFVKITHFTLVIDFILRNYFFYMQSKQGDKWDVHVVLLSISHRLAMKFFHYSIRFFNPSYANEWKLTSSDFDHGKFDKNTQPASFSEISNFNDFSRKTYCKFCTLVIQFSL